MITPLRCAQDANILQWTYVLWFLGISWTLCAAIVCTATSSMKRRKRGSIAVPKTSKKGEECFYNNTLRLPFCIVALV